MAIGEVILMGEIKERVVLENYGDREMLTECVVGPPLCEPLIGQIVLEGLDLIIDPVRRRLVPRPESPFLPMVKLKRVGEINVRTA